MGNDNSKEQTHFEKFVECMIEKNGNETQKMWFKSYKEYLDFDQPNKSIPVGLYELLGFRMVYKNEHDFDKILNNLYLGSDDMVCLVHKLDDLQSLGVTHIVDMREEAESVAPYLHNNKFSYVNFKWHDDPTFDIVTEGKIYKVIDYLHTCLTNGCVYLNCAAGISRSSTVCIAYLILKHNMLYQEAVDMVKKCREKIDPNSGFKWELMKISNSEHEFGEKQLLINQLMTLLPSYIKNTKIHDDVKKQLLNEYLNEHHDSGHYHEFIEIYKNRLTPLCDSDPAIIVSL